MKTDASAFPTGRRLFRKRRLLAAAALSVCAGALNAAPLAVVENGKSSYVIYHAPDAPTLVIRAAREAQRVIEASTGVKLPVVTVAASPMISLGDTPEARKAGLEPAVLPPDGFAIRTAGRDVFIAGHDVPEGTERWRGQASNGTLYGAYSFLEDAVGVRWLFPGDLGEDIPALDSLVVPETDTTRRPSVRFRYLTNIHERTSEATPVWKARNRILDRHWFSFGHAWDDHPPAALVREHPEWMAMYKDGTRSPVPDGRSKNVFYCLSQEGLVRAYADDLIRLFNADPAKFSASLSSADGYTGCRCPECSKMVLTDDGGKWNRFGGYGESITPMILKFYVDAARRVAAGCPDRLVGGLIYRNYVYPPDAWDRLPSNLVLNIAVLNAYGFKYYKPAVAAEFPRMIEGWARYAQNFAWTDYSTWMRNPHGAVLPPGLPILKMIFPALAEHKFLMVNWTGQSEWGTGAAHNYIVARLLWDPRADVDALYWEFLNRAYGPESARAIDRIYRLNEERLMAYIRAGAGPRDPSYDVNADYMKQVCAPIAGEVESLYSQAMEQARTDRQRERLAWFGKILIVQNFNLRRGGLLPAAEKSRFYKSDDDYAVWLAEEAKGIALNPHMWPAKDGRIPTIFLAQERRLTIPFLRAGAQPPRIDGDLSDPAWEKAALASDFRRVATQAPAGQQTEVRMIFDASTLYIGVRCNDAEAGTILASCTQNDSASLFNDDTFELFLGHRTDHEKTYWQVAFNPAGARYDAVAAESAYNLKLTSVAKKRDDGWTLEMAIPFASLNLSAAPHGQTWRGNFGRSRKTGERENTSWAHLAERFHEPRNFGVWVFEGK